MGWGFGWSGLSFPLVAKTNQVGIARAAPWRVTDTVTEGPASSLSTGLVNGAGEEGQQPRKGA